jgi:predicted nucleic acid-binding protein
MTGNDVFFDTNIIIEIFRGNREFVEKVKEVSPIYISSVVLGELYIGINRVPTKKSTYSY